MSSRVGFFGILGSGNLGNDGSLDAVVAYVRERHPDAAIDFMAMGPEQLRERYQAPATHLQWYEAHAGDATGAHAAALKIMGKLLDPFRTLAWVRVHDVVIVPGAGVLETTLPLRPWALPYALFWLGVAGRLVGTKVALVSVGANVVSNRLTRWMITKAARLADYRSFRDTYSREAMLEMGVPVGNDPVYPDLAFALPEQPTKDAVTGWVGVGVMAYYGGEDDRAHAEEINRVYLGTMKAFVRWLVDNGRRVRLFTGDQEDDDALAEVLADLGAHRPEALQTQVVAEPTATLADLMRQMATVDTVVATRYHNVVSALKLCLPTVSVGYATKNDVLMESLRLGEFCLSAQSVDLEQLVERFGVLESQADELRERMRKRNTNLRRQLDEQFEDLSVALFGARFGTRDSASMGVR